jgi:phosphopantetheinyl transferase (holo-ACP synthase)
MGIVGIGIDLVSIPDFADQVDQPGTVFAETFTPPTRVRRRRGTWRRGGRPRRP